MALKFHPEPGTLLLCDFSTGFCEPEMVKRRPVVVISPRLKRRDGLLGVVPLSTQQPTPMMDYHYELTLEVPLPAPFDSRTMWAKADMVSTVGFHRLDLFREGRGPDGRRKYLARKIEDAQLRSIHRAMLHGLGLGHLTAHV
ncbi:type II toxin-antitoxin system PemK/MazF family toxin [uncultured Bosea sp.]|uniref:type II toxin-antitoxin system PemK/MazF family toxin n=1 Tax=uncultured Bosea sp. TaxID=211457 RepID=UPI00263AF75F|nr:type II toxin-antitoxin system PemK/MazF family toxin [uncultured Bosea sp.]